jgi:hypothetical protein
VLFVVAADDVAACRGEIIAVVVYRGTGGRGHEAAARLAKRTGLAVENPDVEPLADAGLLAVAGWYEEWPLWDCRRCLGEAQLHKGQRLGESIA